MDNSNAGQRVLGARTTLSGGANSLESILTQPIVDGASCFVTEEFSSFRFHRGCSLPADGVHIVKSVNGPGRWLREGRSVGLVLIESQKPGERFSVEGTEDVVGPAAQDYFTKLAVQFEVSPKGGVVKYTGAAPRAALVVLSVSVLVDRGRGQILAGPAGATVLATGTVGATAVAVLAPGDSIGTMLGVTAGTLLQASYVSLSIVLL